MRTSHRTPYVPGFALVLACAFVLPALAGCATVGGGDPTELPDRAAERRLALQRLDDDLRRTDQTIEVTRTLVSRSAGRPYLPDLYIRLAELYVEKSRYLYFKAVESKPEGAAEAIDVPEVRLLKDQAVSIYQKLLRDFPGYAQTDKVYFFLAHEYRELGLRDAMRATYRQIVESHPKSLYAQEAHLVLGNDAFREGNLPEAESHYRHILDLPEGPLHEMAQYKLAWIRVNQDRCPEALQLLEGIARKAIASPADAADDDEATAEPDGAPAVGGKKLLTVRREALVDSVYCFSETRKPEEAVAFYRDLARTRELFVTVAARLAARYEVKGDPAAAARMLREAAERTYDPEWLVERVTRLYAAVREAQQHEAVARDVTLLARAADAVRADWRLPADERTQRLQSFEVYARDLITRAQVASRAGGAPALLAAVADAYGGYLEAFPGSPHEAEMRSNEAEALFEAGRHVAAGEAYSKLAAALPEGPEREAVMFSGIVAYRKALDTPGLHHLDVVVAQEGLKRLGGLYVQAYPSSPRRVEVEFNIARQHYDQGDYPTAVERFKAFVKTHPQHRDATAAAHLAMDALFRLEDLDGLAAYGRELLASGLGDATFKKEVEAIVQGAESRRIAKVTVSTDRSREDRARELLEMAAGGQGEASAEALHTAYQLYREAENWAQMFAVGRQLVEADREGRYAREVFPDLATRALASGRFVQAAEAYEALQRVVPAERDGLRVAALIRDELGDAATAARDYTLLLQAGDNDAVPALLRNLAAARDWAGLAAAGQRLKATDAAWSALAVGRAALETGDAAGASAAWSAALKGDGSAAARGEIAYRLGALTVAEFDGLRFSGAPGDSETAARAVRLVKNLQEIDRLGAATGDARWAFAALHRSGLMFARLAAFLRSMPLPAGQTAGERDALRAAIEQKAAPLAEAASQAFDTCRRKAYDAHVFNAYVMGCVRAGEAVLADHPAVSRPLTAAESEAEATLFGRLRKGEHAPSVVAALARLMLAGGAPERAALFVLGNLGGDERPAELLTVLGAARLRRGDPQEAYAAWAEAAAAGDSVARLNLAVLRWQFGDGSGARAELGRVNGLSGIELGRADVHPAAAAAVAELQGGP